MFTHLGTCAGSHNTLNGAKSCSKVSHIEGAWASTVHDGGSRAGELADDHAAQELGVGRRQGPEIGGVSRRGVDAQQVTGGRRSDVREAVQHAVGPELERRHAEAGGADAISLINTCLGMAADWRRRRPILGNVTGGLSGPAIKPIALRAVYPEPVPVGAGTSVFDVHG